MSSISESMQELGEKREVECTICNDQEWFVDANDNWKAKPCKCREKKMLARRIKNALIPEEFENARFDNYIINSAIQRTMYETAQKYLADFDKIVDSHVNSLGFIAEVGEQQIKRIPDLRQRAEAAREYNSFGLGKTHLQIAVAKELLHRGYAVLCISDATFMHDLAQSKRYGDENAEFNRLIGAAIDAPVLLWDDIGKSKYSETKEELYYRIINERYKARKPIIFSSNEDELTLSERIGDAAFSRLYGMSKNYFLKLKGPDFRMIQGA